MKNYIVCEYFSTIPSSTGQQGVCVAANRNVECDGLISKCEYPAHLSPVAHEALLQVIGEQEAGVLHSITTNGIPLIKIIISGRPASFPFIEN